jgi:hypothetical protein
MEKKTLTSSNSIGERYDRNGSIDWSHFWPSGARIHDSDQRFELNPACGMWCRGTLYARRLSAWGIFGTHFQFASWFLARRARSTGRGSGCNVQSADVFRPLGWGFKFPMTTVATASFLSSGHPSRAREQLIVEYVLPCDNPVSVITAGPGGVGRRKLMFALTGWRWLTLPSFFAKSLHMSINDSQ